jgi:hypothetical protein
MAGIAATGSLEFAAQCAPDKFGQAQFLAPRLIGPKLFDCSRKAER